MADTVEFTAEEIAELKSIISKSDESIKSLSQKAADSSRALRNALLASEYDVENVKALALAAEKAEAAVIGAHIDEWTRIRSILTADQVKKYKEMTSKRSAGPPPAASGR